jgi:hypothetical protein
MHSFTKKINNQQTSSKNEIDIDLTFLESDFNQEGGNLTDSISINTSDFITNNRFFTGNGHY